MWKKDLRVFLNYVNKRIKMDSFSDSILGLKTTYFLEVFHFRRRGSWSRRGVVFATIQKHPWVSGLLQNFTTRKSRPPKPKPKEIVPWKKRLSLPRRGKSIKCPSSKLPTIHVKRAELALSHFFRRWPRRQPTRCVRNSRDLSMLVVLRFFQLQLQVPARSPSAWGKNSSDHWPEKAVPPRRGRRVLVPNGAFGCLKTYLV